LQGRFAEFATVLEVEKLKGREVEIGDNAWSYLR
jgi:hypothetical protein